jgi:hypothetical protein
MIRVASWAADIASIGKSRVEEWPKFGLVLTRF